MKKPLLASAMLACLVINAPSLRAGEYQPDSLFNADLAKSLGGWAADANGKCGDHGAPMEGFDGFCRHVMAGVCDDPGLNSNYNADACAAKEAVREKAEAEENQRHQAALEARERAEALAKCNDKPTTIGVLFCRWGVK